MIIETPGEDPFHLSSYVHSLIQGLQGDDPKYKKVVATCKHFAGYDMENWNGSESCLVRPGTCGL
jgi:beta-D-xylosidase 4